MTLPHVTRASHLYIPMRDDIAERHGAWCRYRVKTGRSPWDCAYEEGQETMAAGARAVGKLNVFSNSQVPEFSRTGRWAHCLVERDNVSGWLRRLSVRLNCYFWTSRWLDWTMTPRMKSYLSCVNSVAIWA